MMSKTSPMRSGQYGFPAKHFMYLAPHQPTSKLERFGGMDYSPQRSTSSLTVRTLDSTSAAIAGVHRIAP